MDENIFNLSKEYNDQYRYWDFGNKYRVYAGSFSSYNDYVRQYEIKYCFYKANSTTNFANKYPYQFYVLNPSECIALNIVGKRSPDFKGAFEKYFFTLYNMYNGTCSSSTNITKEETSNSSNNIVIAGPCSVCGTADKWNSVNNNKSYCYKHCKY
jgi:hypothetical protein